MDRPTPLSETDDVLAAHDAWFRAEVERALREADRPDAEWVSEDEVRRLREARRAAWQAPQTPCK